MTSASEAVKRLKGESLQQKSLTQLKEDAADLELTKEDVREFGNLSHKQTWVDAINDAVGKLFDEPEDSHIPVADSDPDEDIFLRPFQPVEQRKFVYQKVVDDDGSETYGIGDKQFSSILDLINYLEAEDFPAELSQPPSEPTPEPTPEPSSAHNEVESTVQPIQQRYEAEDVEDGNGNTIWFIYDRETCQWICENAGDYQGYSTKEEASQRVKELCVTANRNTQTEPQPEPQRIDCFIPKAIHYPKHEIYRIWDTLNDAWVQDEQGYDTKEEAQKRIQQLAQ